MFQTDKKMGPSKIFLLLTSFLGLLNNESFNDFGVDFGSFGNFLIIKNSHT